MNDCSHAWIILLFIYLLLIIHFNDILIFVFRNIIRAYVAHGSIVKLICITIKSHFNGLLRRIIHFLLVTVFFFFVLPISRFKIDEAWRVFSLLHLSIFEKFIRLRNNTVFIPIDPFHFYFLTIVEILNILIIILRSIFNIYIATTINLFLIITSSITSHVLMIFFDNESMLFNRKVLLYAWYRIWLSLALHILLTVVAWHLRN